MRGSIISLYKKPLYPLKKTAPTLTNTHTHKTKTLGSSRFVPFFFETLEYLGVVVVLHHNHYTSMHNRLVRARNTWCNLLYGIIQVQTKLPKGDKIHIIKGQERAHRF